MRKRFCGFTVPSGGLRFDNLFYLAMYATWGDDPHGIHGVMVDFPHDEPIKDHRGNPYTPEEINNYSWLINTSLFCVPGSLGAKARTTLSDDESLARVLHNTKIRLPSEFVSDLPEMLVIFYDLTLIHDNPELDAMGISFPDFFRMGLNDKAEKVREYLLKTQNSLSVKPMKVTVTTGPRDMFRFSLYLKENAFSAA